MRSCPDTDIDPTNQHTRVIAFLGYTVLETLVSMVLYEIYEEQQKSVYILLMVLTWLVGVKSIPLTGHDWWHL